jgi:hypothetical protein
VLGDNRPQALRDLRVPPCGIERSQSSP